MKRLKVKVTENDNKYCIYLTWNRNNSGPRPILYISSNTL